MTLQALTVLVVEELANKCPSTAMCYTMHTGAVAAATQSSR